MRIEALESIAREMVGDDKTPDLFFVSQGDKGVIAICRFFDDAYNVWRNLPRNAESSLENRKLGVICSVEPRDDDDSRLVVYDDSLQFKVGRKSKGRTVREFAKRGKA